jgi:hypothetical protein
MSAGDGGRCVDALPEGGPVFRAGIKRTTMSDERAIIDDMLTDIYRYRHALKQISGFGKPHDHPKECVCGWPTCVAAEALRPRVRESNDAR